MAETAPSIKNEDLSSLENNKDALTRWMLKHKNNGIVHAILKWQIKYPNIYQFIIFNLLSNCATITNFAVSANDVAKQLRAQGIDVDANGYFTAPKSFTLNMTATSIP